MNFNDYQKETRKTAVYPTDMEVPALYPAVKLSGEAGEVTEHFGKALRDDDGQITAKRRTEISKELGDVLWYIARIADDLGMDLNEIANTNLAKLARRQEQGTIKGSGDDR